MCKHLCTHYTLGMLSASRAVATPTLGTPGVENRNNPGGHPCGDGTIVKGHH